MRRQSPLASKGQASAALLEKGSETLAVPGAGQCYRHDGRARRLIINCVTRLITLIAFHVDTGGITLRLARYKFTRRAGTMENGREESLGIGGRSGRCVSGLRGITVAFQHATRYAVEYLSGESHRKRSVPGIQKNTRVFLEPCVPRRRGDGRGNIFHNFVVLVKQWQVCNSLGFRSSYFADE